MSTSSAQPVVTVIVADDEPDIRLLCRVNLEAAGYEVLEARDGQEVVALTSASRADVVLLDITMPVMDGWTTLTRLRGDPDLADLAIVMLSAHVGWEHEKEALEQGASGYLTKPFTTPELLRVVESAVATTTRQRGGGTK